MPPETSNVPVEVVLKAIVDKTGSQSVKDFLTHYTASTKDAEESVGRTSALLDKMGSQVSHITAPLRELGGLLGVAGVGAAYHQYLAATTSGAELALAQGHATGNTSTFAPYEQALLGVQSRTGVAYADVETGLRNVAQMAGASLSAEGAGRFGALLAGASLTTGMSASAVSQIVGSFLQSSGGYGGSGAAGQATANATSLMAGVTQALSAFPGSQKEPMLPAVASLYQSQALGAMGGGPSSGAATMAGYINTLARQNPLFRNPANVEAGAAAIGGVVEGSISSGPGLALMHAVGIGGSEMLEGFTPENAAKLAMELPGLWGAGTPYFEQQTFGKVGRKQLETAREAIVKRYHGNVQAYIAAERYREAHPNVSAYEREMNQAILSHTPEAALSKTQATVEGGLFGNAVAQWLGASPLHLIAGAAGLRAAWRLGEKALGAAGRAGLAALGEDSGAAILGDTLSAGLLSVPMAIFGPEMPGTGGPLGESKAQQLYSLKSYEQQIVREALRQHGPGAMEAYIRAHVGHRTAEGVVPGGSPNAMLRTLRGIEEVGQVPHVLAEAAQHFGKDWLGLHWQENKHIAGSAPEQANKYIQEHLHGEALQKADEDIKKLREYSTLGPQGYAAKQQQESTDKFSAAVEKFAKAVQSEGHKNAAYVGQGHAGAVGASFVQGSLASAPGATMIALMEWGRHGGGAGPQNASYGGPQDVAYEPTSSGWNALLRKYSGGSYGLSYVEQLAREHPGGGAHPGDRRIVEGDARRYGVPFSVLWGIYGAESSFGRAASSFGLTGQFPGSGTSGNFSTDARMSAEDLRRLMGEMHIHVTLDGRKQRNARVKISHAVPA